MHQLAGAAASAAAPPRLLLRAAVVGGPLQEQAAGRRPPRGGPRAVPEPVHGEPALRGGLVRPATQAARPLPHRQHPLLKINTPCHPASVTTASQSHVNKHYLTPHPPVASSCHALGETQVPPRWHPHGIHMAGPTYSLARLPPHQWSIKHIHSNILLD